MLELKKITKDYLAGENAVHALKGIDLKFRKSEFVSILGPSGCGKTTMLNIIGGLDQYSDGDLVINGRSTKDYKDRDWDAYRNHSIGFVFQSYNLIPHQTVLQNVELALTLSGVGKEERRERAIKALKEVGLENQLKKRPSEMSGGQMQRVALARAIVNNPDIILADEPTGALDTKTSVQVMDILKKIAENRLVIMVTHNPELAEKYSTRIVKMTDGCVTEDSNPLTKKDIQMENVRDKTIKDEEKEKKKKKPSMSMATSFGLSLKNLFTKKGRTILTSFAGSIGIIGIALIYAVSQGFQNYIDTIQEETLSSYPLTLEASSTDLSSIMETFMNLHDEETEHEMDAVYKRSAVYEIVNAFNNAEKTENDLKSFKSYIEAEKDNEESEISKALNGIQYTYDYDMLVYTKNTDGNIIVSDTQELMGQLIAESMNIDMESMSGMSSSTMLGGGMSSSGSSSMMGGGMTGKLWQEMLCGKDGSVISPLILKQYDLVYGEWPNNYDEIVLVLDKNNELNDMALYALGLESKDDVDAIMSAAIEGTALEKDESEKWSYKEICDQDYRVVLNSDCYSFDSATNTYKDLRETEAGLTYLYDNALNLKVKGIIKPKEDATAAMLSGSIGYTEKLTEYIINNSSIADVINAQLDDPDRDVITGLPFKPDSTDLSDKDKKGIFTDYIDSLNDEDKIKVFEKIKSIPTEEELKQMSAPYLNIPEEQMKETVVQSMAQQMNMKPEDVEKYITKMSSEDLKAMYQSGVEEQVKSQYAAQASQALAQLSDAQKKAGLDAMMDSMTDAQYSYYYEEIIEFSSSDFDTNLRSMGYLDLDEPSSINLYASSFENKDVIEDAIKDYNEGKDEMKQIKYTDYIGILMSGITTIINAITYVLIAFVSISLIVSSIMIGVITLISVQERTKEIGILRAIGASKKNVSNMFNAETMLIGLAAGLLGVVVSWLLTFPINAIINHLTGINNLKAVLPVYASLILIAISVLLTLISGIIPSRSAAKKDPVVALRTE